MSLIKKLKQPFPYLESHRGKFRMAVFFGLFIFVFLLLFKPFTLDTIPATRFWIAITSYGVITFTGIFLTNICLPLLAPSFFNERNWTTGKQLFLSLLVIFIVGLCNYLVSPFLVGSSLNFGHVLWFQAITLSMSLLPITILTLIRQNRLLLTFRKEAQAIDLKLKEKLKQKDNSTGTYQVPVVTLVGDYKNEKIEIPTDKLCLISSADNYIKIYYEQKDKLSYAILRLSMKKAEEYLRDYENFLKCHRAYIINLDKVEHIEGNAQGYKVKLENISELVPVSRNLNTQFSDKLLASRKHASYS